MKRLGFILSLIAISSTAMGQMSKVTAASSNIKYGQFDKAKEAIDLALQHEKSKDHPKTWMVRGDLYKAIAESKDPNVKALAENGKPTTVAFDSYLHAIELDTKGTLRKQINTSLSLMSFTVVNCAIEYNDKEDYASALECFEQSLAIDSLTEPGKIDSAIVFNAGFVAAKGKINDKAKYYCNKAIDIQYGGTQPYSILGDVYKSEGDTVAYIQLLEKGMAAYPEESALIVELINHYITSDQSDKALEYLATAIEKDATNKSFYFAKGSLCDKLGNAEEARAAYEKAIELDSNYFDPWFNLGIQVYNQSIEMAKAANDIPASKQKEYDAAIAAAYERMNQSIPYFEKAISIKEDVYTMQALRECYFKLRNLYPEYNDKASAIKARLDEMQQ